MDAAPNPGGQATSRLLFIHDDFTVLGGGERLLLRVAQVAHRLARPSLALLFPGGHDALDASRSVFERIVRLDCPATFSLWSLPQQLTSRQRMKTAVEDIQPGACIAFSYPGAVRLAGWRATGNVPLVWVCQEDVDSLLTRGTAWRRRLVFSLIRRAGMHVVCLSQTASQQFASVGFPSAQLHLIPNSPAVPTEHDALDASSRAQLRAQAGVHEDSLVAICVAHLNPVKGHEVLLNAVDRARRAGVPVTLICVGAQLRDHADYAERLHSLTSSLNLSEHILWVGEQQDVYKWLALADVAVLASAHEAAPTFLLEASLAGLPLVGSDVSGIRDLIAQGETGELFRAGDAEACAAALIRMARDPSMRRSFGASARERVLAARGRSEEQWEALLRSLNV